MSNSPLVKTTLSETSQVPPKEWPYILILTAIQVVHILDFVIMMPIGPQLMRVLEIGPSEFGLLVSSYSFGAGFFGILGAIYLDSFDRKKLLMFFFSGFVIGTFCCAISSNYYLLLFARLLTGSFGGITNSCVFAMVADLIPAERRGGAMGIVMSAFPICSILGIPIGVSLANYLNWHATFYFIVLLSLIPMVGLIFFLPNIPFEGEKINFKKKVHNLWDTTKNYFSCFTINVPLAFGLFGIVPFISPYMVKNVGMSETDLPLFYFVGGACTIISSRAIGKLTDRFGSKRVFLYVCVISMIPILLLTHLPPIPLWKILIVSSFFMMTVSGRFIPSVTMISLIIPAHKRGGFMALENSFRLFASGVSSFIAGAVIHETSSGKLENYSYMGYFGVLFTFVAMGMVLRLTKRYANQLSKS